MAQTITVYGLAQGHFGAAAINWTADTIQVSLHTSTYSPAQDTDDFFNDATNELAASGNYTSGGAALANKTKAYTAGTNVEKFDADDLTWTALTPSAAFRYGVIHKVRGGAATADELIAYIDFGADQNPGGSDFTIQWNAGGIFTMTAA